MSRSALVAIGNDVRISDARPFLKWVGGKGQLIPVLDKCLPLPLKQGKIHTYIEPFVGGGAVFFHISQLYDLKRVVLADSNPDLITAYLTVQASPLEVIRELRKFESSFLGQSQSQRSLFYYSIREEFNAQRDRTKVNRLPKSSVKRTAQLIFLNRTCFNGLYRVNSSGAFNVSFGRYENPTICDEENILRAANALFGVEILSCDFAEVEEFAGQNSFMYLDPPYRPISDTSNFTSYSSATFTQLDQQRLVNFCDRVDACGGYLLMSNSDPTNTDPDDEYFQQMFPKFTIHQVWANRMVNCKAGKRGKIRELLISNYDNGTKS